MEERKFSCDILRIMAFCFVILVHSISRIGFYSTVTDGPIMLIFNILRCLFITCVPLFIILSGYLMKEKEFNKNYVKKISKTVITYILCSIFCLIFLHFIEKREIWTIKEYIFSILSFNAAPYSWYINMYIGLYLLIPFLNILWNNLKTKENKIIFLEILMILIVLPTALNIWNFNSLEWWLKPSISNTYQALVPDFWMGGGYVILYYYIGCYLKEYKLKMSLKKNLVLIIFCLIIFGAFNYYRNYGTLFVWAIYDGYQSFEVLIVTALLANLILNNIKIKINNKFLATIVSKISSLTLGAYLVSVIFDSFYYSYIFRNTEYLKERLLLWIPVVIMVILSSILLSYFINIIQKNISKIIVAIKKRLGHSNKLK